MSQVYDIERYIEGSLVSGLRALFYTDVEFPYKEDGSSKIQITSAYPSLEECLVLPQLTIGDMSYAISDMSLQGNYIQDIIVNGINVGKEYYEIVPFDCRISIGSSSEMISKILASKTIFYIRYPGREFFERTLNLKISSIRKSPGGYSPVGDKKTFSSFVSISGEVKVRVREIYVDEHLVSRANRFMQNYVME